MHNSLANTYREAETHRDDDIGRCRSVVSELEELGNIGLNAAYTSATKISLAAATSRIQARTFKDYLGFTYYHGITDITSLGAILAYFQHLTQLGLQSCTILNYISALKAQLEWAGYLIDVSHHNMVKAFCRSILRVPGHPKLKSVFTPEQIDTLFRVNRTLLDYQSYAAAFVLGFYACLRISNIVPSSRMALTDDS